MHTVTLPEGEGESGANTKLTAQFFLYSGLHFAERYLDVSHNP
jgi:hypothetical protein